MIGNILLIGMCGTGKTWVMKSLIRERKVLKRQKICKLYFHSNDDLIVLGKYDGSLFEGSDRLSMSAITDISLLLQVKKEKIVIAEGDRFMNSTYINKMNPVIIKIRGDGKKGRELRGSNQTERHLKSVSTRVSNINANFIVENSVDALKMINKLIDEGYDKGQK